MSIAKNDYHLGAFYNGIMTQKPLLYKYQFVVKFGGADMAYYLGCPNPQELTYYVQNTTIPQFQLTKAETTFLGTKFASPGVKKFNHSWNCTILLDEELTGFQYLRNWRQKISSLDSDGGGIKKIPNTYMKISLLNNTNQYEYQSFILQGIWITNLSDLTFNYADGGGQNMKNNVSFQYQYCYPCTPQGGISQDPLANGRQL